MPTTTRRHTLTLAGLEVPVIELTGAADGPRLTVLAGVHGCEYASMAGVRQWARSLEERDLRGRVVAVPVLNLPAFRARTPFLVPDDGKNLNRCFPGDPAGTLADRLAYDAFTQLISGSDALVDAHTGDMVEALEPFALYDAGPAEARARELASAYGLGAIIAEAGGCGLVERAAVDAHVRGLDHILAALGMTGSSQAEAGPAHEPAYLRRFLWLRCEDEGWWEPAVSPGEAVAAGQLLGTVSSLDGARLLQTITAPAAGVPMFITSSPAVAADGLLLGLGAA
jgi:predicted deacylase